MAAGGLGLVRIRAGVGRFLVSRQTRRRLSNGMMRIARAWRRELSRSYAATIPTPFGVPETRCCKLTNPTRAALSRLGPIATIDGRGFRCCVRPKHASVQHIVVRANALALSLSEQASSLPPNSVPCAPIDAWKNMALVQTGGGPRFCSRYPARYLLLPGLCPPPYRSADKTPSVQQEEARAQRDRNRPASRGCRPRRGTSCWPTKQRSGMRSRVCRPRWNRRQATGRCGDFDSIHSNRVLASILAC